MKWNELTNEQRNKLIHEKVMGAATICSARLIITPVNAPKGRVFCYMCTACELVGNCDSEDTIPKEHPPVVEVPRYSTDMNAAWEIVESVKFAGVLVERLYKTSDERKYVCKITSRADDQSASTTMRRQASSFGKTAQDAICRAALEVMGVEIE